MHLDHQLFLLEDVNRFALPYRLVQSEIAVLGTHEPDVGFAMWQADPTEWPVSSLLANEAVHAAKAQGPAAAEQLDWALRLAFFRDSRCITLLHVILDVAASCPAVDADRLGADLESGGARGPMLRRYRADRDQVKGSPHLFLPDGTDAFAPGLELTWSDEPGKGFPVVTHDDPDAVRVLLEQHLSPAR